MMNEQMKDSFYVKMRELIQLKPKIHYITAKKYGEMLQHIKVSKVKTSGKNPGEYQQLKRYDVVQDGGVEKLIFPVSQNRGRLQYYACLEDLFGIIHETHLRIWHGGKNKMLAELKKRYRNVTHDAVMIYLSLCEACKNPLSKKRPRKDRRDINPEWETSTDMQPQDSGEHLKSQNPTEHRNQFVGPSTSSSGFKPLVHEVLDIKEEYVVNSETEDTFMPVESEKNHSGNDPEMHFCLSLHASLCRIPKKFRNNAKIDLLQVIDKYENMHL